MPTTLFFGRPQAFCSAHTMASSGLVTHDDEGVGRVLLDAGAGLVHDLDVDAEQVVAAHAGLARHAGGDDDDVGAFDVGVGVGGLQVEVEALDGAGLAEVEPLAAGNAFDDVEQDDVAEFLEADEMSKRSADHASADQRDFGARHCRLLLDGVSSRSSSGHKAHAHGLVNPKPASVSRTTGGAAPQPSLHDWSSRAATELC